MSDQPVSAPAAESAPAAADTTESIVSSSLSDLHEAETAEAAPTSTPAASAAPGASSQPGATPTAPPPTAAEVDELAAALGITGDGTQKWTTRVAYSKVSKAVKALQAKQTAAHEAALKSHTDRLAETQSQIDRFDSLVSNPDQLLAALASVNPAYQRFLGQKPAAAPAGVPQRIETIEDLQRVIDAQVAAKLAPIEQERNSRQMYEAAVPKVRAQIAEAEKWPLFTENKAEILTALQSNPTWGLKDAYQHVAIPKLAGTRDQMRQQVLDELKTRPHSSTVTTTVAGRGSQGPEALDTESVVRAALANIRD